MPIKILVVKGIVKSKRLWSPLFRTIQVLLSKNEEKPCSTKYNYARYSLKNFFKLTVIQKVLHEFVRCVVPWFFGEFLLL